MSSARHGHEERAEHRPVCDVPAVRFAMIDIGVFEQAFRKLIGRCVAGGSRQRRWSEVVPLTFVSGLER